MGSRVIDIAKNEYINTKNPRDTIDYSFPLSLQ